MNKIEIINKLKENGMNAAVFYARTNLFLKGTTKNDHHKVVINGIECVPSKEVGVHVRPKEKIIITYYENKRFENNIHLYVYVPDLSGSYSFFVKEIDFFNVLDFYAFENFNSNKLYGSSYKLTEALAEKEIIEEMNWEGKITFSELDLPGELVDESTEYEMDYDDGNPLYSIRNYALEIKNEQETILMSINHYDYEWNTPIEIDTIVDSEVLSMYQKAEQDAIFTMENAIVTQRHCVGYSTLFVSDKESGDVELVIFQKDPSHYLFYKEDLEEETRLFSGRGKILEQLKIKQAKAIFA